MRPCDPREGRPEVLVVDDSAVSREVLRSILTQAGFEVHTAPSAELALRRAAERRVSVIVLDLNLPGMSGLELMSALAAPRPPIVICSALAASDANVAIAALAAGAVDVIGKPELGVHAFLEGAAARIVQAVRTALRGPSLGPAPAGGLGARRVSSATGHAQVIALGASAGGVEALHYLLAALPRGTPPIVLVQHIPAAFSAAFARRLDQRCALGVGLARDGEALARGRVYVAPGGRHLQVILAANRLLCRVTDSDPVKRHRPSVDVLFGSLAHAAPSSCVAALLTGMGDDGVDGLLALRHAGAITIAQDESSSAVYGMPREAARRGAACEVLSLQQIAPRLLELSLR